MKIYLDYIFFENLVVNLILIYQTSVFIKKKPKIINAVISVILLSVYTTICYAFSNTYFDTIFVKIISIGISIYIAYVPRNIKELIKENLYFYLISFLFVGIIISISLFLNIPIEKKYIKIFIYAISAVILYIFNSKMWKVWKSNIKKSDLNYVLNIAGKKINAFIDTGNSVKEPITGLDVIFLSRELFDEFNKKNILNKSIPLSINTISSKTYEKAYIIKNIEVYKTNEKIASIDKIVVSFTKNNIKNGEKYKALIGYNTYLEKLRGVMI